MSTSVQLNDSKSQVLSDVSNILMELLLNNSKALPKNFNQTRFLQNCLTVLGETKNIDKCTPISVAKTMIKGAYLGLDFFRKECYAIPYEILENRRATGKYELNFQTDYKGEKKLCMQYSERSLLDIYARIVREGDELEVGIKEGKQIVNFNPKEFNDAKVIGAFAVAYFNDGGMAYDAMSIKEIDKVRENYAKKNTEGEYGPSWRKSPEEMQKKTVLRRLCKMISLNFDNSEQDQAFQEGSLMEIISEVKEVDKKIADPFAKKNAEDAQVSSSVPSASDLYTKSNDEMAKKKADLRAKFKSQYPNEEEWQLEARIDEAAGVVK